MKKVRSNASWNKISSKNRETLDTWLFEDNLSYTEIHPKAQKELGFPGSLASLKRYYARRKQERLETDMLDVGKDAVKTTKTGATPDELRVASMRVLGVYLFQALRENPKAIKEMMPVVKAMLQNDYNETLRQSKDRELTLREKVHEFAKEKYELDMAEKALKALPELQELAEARKDPLTKRYEENARRNRLRRMMFGAGHDVQPESPQEETEMLAMKQEREERKRQQSEALPEATSMAGPPGPSSQYYEDYLEAKEAEKHENGKLTMEDGNIEQPTSNAEHPVVAEAERAGEAQRAEAEKRRKYREVRTRFEEIRPLRSDWKKLSRPPGWEKQDGWKDAPLEWDLEKND